MLFFSLSLLLCTCRFKADEDTIVADQTKNAVDMADRAGLGQGQHSDMRTLTDMARDEQSGVTRDNTQTPSNADIIILYTTGNAEVNPLLTATLQCDVISHSGCEVSGMERCEEPGHCACLRGFVRTAATNKCVAAQFFQGTITFKNTFSQQQLAPSSSKQYTSFVGSVRKTVVQALVSEGAQGVLDVYVTSVSLDKETGRVTVDWEVAVKSSSNPLREELMKSYNKGIVKMAYVDPDDSLIKLTDTEFVLGENGTMANFLQPLVEFSHCIDTDHNYCDVNADCFHRLGSFVCTCRQGFDDVSPDVINTPGERCAQTCECRNNGNCSRDSIGNMECNCPDWYTGSRCEVDGKEVLIITCSVLGFLLLVLAATCTLCFCFSKKARKSSRGSAIGGATLDTSVMKLPRVWMDSTRPYELPPRDMRRWSYVSEPVKYIDEYMMDDYVHAGTLPLPRSQDAKKKYYAAYPHGTMNHAYSSSTLSARPPYRH